jgi:hypothetical protein
VGRWLFPVVVLAGVVGGGLVSSCVLRLARIVAVVAGGGYEGHTIFRRCEAP